MRVAISGDGDLATVKVSHVNNGADVVDVRIEVTKPDLKDALVSAVESLTDVQNKLIAELRRLGLAQKPPEEVVS